MISTCDYFPFGKISNSVGLYLPGYSLNDHLELVSAYSRALSINTWRNKALHVRVYLSFAQAHAFDPLAPTLYDILALLVHLDTRLRSPGAVLNYFSGVKTWLETMTGETAIFNSYQVKTLKRSITKNSNHIVTRARPLTPLEFKDLIVFLSGLGSDTRPVVVALIIAYLTLLRQSNIASLSSTSIGPHTLRFEDVICTPNALHVTIHTTKTRSAAYPPLVFRLPALPSSPCCPVQAWVRYAKHLHPPPGSPAFLLNDGSALTVTALAKLLGHAASAVLQTNAHTTLHSLRRGAAQACLAAGLSLDDIKQAGSWKGSSVNAYLRAPVITAAPSALASLLG